MTYRVIQWATGGVGQEALRQVIASPDLELVGVFVYSDANNNGTRDGGEAAIGGVTINLTGSDYLDFPVSASTTTSSTDGSYCFNNLQAGTYTISTTTRNSNTDHSKTSAVGDTGFTRHEPAAAVYTITVVPEPATLSLLALSGLGSFGMNVLRRRRRS